MEATASGKPHEAGAMGRVQFISHRCADHRGDQERRWQAAAGVRAADPGMLSLWWAIGATYKSTYRLNDGDQAVALLLIPQAGSAAAADVHLPRRGKEDPAGQHEERRL